MVWTCVSVLYLLICLPYLSTDDIIPVIAVLDAHQDSPENKNGSNTDHETFVAGMVHLKIIIKKPQDLDLEGITFDWCFGDGSQLHNSQLQNVTHNFTTVRSCTINVTIHGMSLRRFYFGTANKTLEFTGRIYLLWMSLFILWYCEFFLGNNSL